MKVLTWNRSNGHVVQIFLQITANPMKLNQPFALFSIHVVITLYVCDGLICPPALYVPEVPCFTQ